MKFYLSDSVHTELLDQETIKQLIPDAPDRFGAARKKADPFVMVRHTSVPTAMGQLGDKAWIIKANDPLTASNAARILKFLNTWSDDLNHIAYKSGLRLATLRVPGRRQKYDMWVVPPIDIDEDHNLHVLSAYREEKKQKAS